MKRRREDKIDDAKYYEEIWSKEVETGNTFDAVRMRALLRDVKPGDFIADVGAGVFGAAEYMYLEMPIRDVRAIAFDQSHTAKEIVNKRCAGLEYVLCDAANIPAASNMFDVVVCGELIEHFENPEVLVQELLRIAKGRVAISTVDHDCEQAQQHEYPEHIWGFSAESLTELCAKHAFTQYQRVGNYHVVYLCK